MADAMFTRIPSTSTPVATSLNYATFSIDASDDAVAWMFQSKTSDPITHLGFRYGVRTGTPPAYLIALEGVSTSTPYPDGTDVGGGSPTATSFTPPADTTWNSTWQWIALTNPYTPTIGQELALTIRYDSVTADTINSSNYSSFSTDSSHLAIFRPLGVRATAGTWSARSFWPSFGYRTASGRYGNVAQSAYTTASASTAGHMKLLKFALPAAWGSTFQLAGISCAVDLGSAGNNPSLVLLDSGHNEIQTHQLDADHGPVNNALVDLYFDGALDTLNYGDTYYVGFKVGASTAGGVTLVGVQLAAADDRLAHPLGTGVCLTSYDGSTYTDDATVIPMVDLILADITEPSGGGGGGGPLIGGRLVL